MNQDNNNQNFVQNNQNQVQGNIKPEEFTNPSIKEDESPGDLLSEPLLSAGISGGEVRPLYTSNNNSTNNSAVSSGSLASQPQPLSQVDGNFSSASVSENPQANPSFESSSPQQGVGSGAFATSLPPDQISTPPKPNKKFPARIFLILFLIIAVLVGLFFAVRVFFGNRINSSKVTTITWWNLWEDDSIVKPLIQEYESKNPNVKINYIKQSPQDYRERLSSALAKGEGPDIFVFHNTWVPIFARDLEPVPASVMNSADLAQNFYYVISADLTSQGRIFGIPLGYDALTLFINEDLFKEAGLNPPTTWVELRQYAKLLTKIVDGKISQSGVALGRVENVDHWQEILALMMIQNSVNFVNPDPSLMENSLLFYTVFSKVDKVWDETLPPSTELFAAGRLAMYFGPSWRAFNIKDMNPNLNFRTVPLPQVPKENPDDPDISYATYWAQGVWAKGKNKEAAWDFLKFISSKESLQEMFKQASLVRGFGEAYPRSDMSNLLIDHPILGSVVKLAPNAKSWYLASRTFDGPTGINSQLSKYFEDAVNGINQSQDSKSVVETLTQGIKQVLIQYGLSR
jgi:multiple sugar transport system substrate-binding protein